MGGLQHFIIIGIHGNIGVHIAVARVHVQRHKHAPAHHAAVDFGQRFGDFGVGLAAENLG